jgi:biopolymer transport protein ExbD
MIPMQRYGRYGHPADSDQTTFRPQLTSLIDVMTFLLVFIIKSFSVQGDVIMPSDNLKLPISATNKPPQPAASIEITATTVMAEGKALSALSAADRTDPLLIPGVYQWMARLREKMTRPSHELPAASASPPLAGVLIQADREIEYANIKRVMYSCSKAGFSDFTILAIQKE